MTYAAVLTQVQADPEAAPRLACAVDVAKRFDAWLIGLAAEMIPPLAFDGGYYSLEADWATAMRESIEGQLKAAREIFCGAAKDLGQRTLWESALQLPGPAIAAASRAADLIVAGGAPRHDDPYRTASPAELAITSGRPVLVAPPGASTLSAERIVLAWKDTREARRALSDSLPFLHRAELVEVVEACPAEETRQAEIRTKDVAAALVRRGVKAEPKVVSHARVDAQQVLREASRIGADLIVAGAYGHTRLGEWVFGGFTRDLLSQDACHLVLSH